MNLLKPITIDRGIRIPEKTDKPQGVYHVFLPQLQAMRIGDSFFREGETKEEITGLLRYAKRLNIHLRAEDLDEDDTYLSPGVRVERVSQDDLPGRKPNDPTGDATFWKIAGLPFSRVVQFAPGDVPPRDAGYKQITPVEYRQLVETCPDHVKYWHHPESESVWTYPIDKEFEGDGLSVEITGEQFAALQKGGIRIDPIHAVSREEPGYTYWHNKITNMILQYNPGHTPDNPSDYIEVDRATYLESLVVHKPVEVTTVTEVELTADKILTTYWRKKNGDCVSVKPEKYDETKVEPGWKEISRNTYVKWIADNEI